MNYKELISNHQLLFILVKIINLSLKLKTNFLIIYIIKNIKFKISLFLKIIVITIRAVNCKNINFYVETIILINNNFI